MYLFRLFNLFWWPINIIAAVDLFILFLYRHESPSLCGMSQVMWVQSLLSVHSKANINVVSELLLYGTELLIYNRLWYIIEW